MVLDVTLLNTPHYKVRIKGKVDQSKEWSSALPTPWCNSYWKGRLLVTPDKGRKLSFFYSNKYREWKRKMADGEPIPEKKLELKEDY